MRTHSAITASLKDRSVQVRVTIGGVVVTQLEGMDWIESVRVTSTVENAVADCEIRIWREAYKLSMAPLAGASKFNATTPLIALMALVIVEVSEQPTAAAATATSDWHEVFRGRIDDIDWAATPISLKCRDMAADVLDRWSEEPLAYAIGCHPYGCMVWEAGRSVRVYSSGSGDVNAGSVCVPSKLSDPTANATPTYYAGNAGLTGTSEPPTWFDVDGVTPLATVTDGEITWHHFTWSITAWAANHAVTFGQVREITDGTWGLVDVVCIQDGTTGATAPTLPTYLPAGSEITACGPAGATVDDGTARWAIYPSTDGGLALESIMRGILEDNFGTTAIPALWTPTRCPYWRIPFVMPAQSVLEFLRSEALSIGWDLRLAYNPAAADHATWGKWRLCLSEPRRANTTSDATFTSDDYFPPSKCAQSLSMVRNIIEVGYQDDYDRWPGGERKRKFVSAKDAPSVAAYGRRFMGLGEGSASNISTETEAIALAAAVCSDLAQPPFDWIVPLPLRWWVELGDLFTFAADFVHFSADQKLAVTGYTHEISAGKSRTTLTTRGKATAGTYAWHAKAARPGRGKPHRHLGRQKPGGAKVTATVAGGVTIEHTAGDVAHPPKGGFGGGAGAGGGYEQMEIHISTSPSFTPSDATIAARGKATRHDIVGLIPGTTYHTKTINIDALGNRSEPSEESSFTTKYVDIADINMRVFESGCAVNSTDRTVAVTTGVSATIPWNTILWGFETQTGVIPRASFNTGTGWRFNEEARLRLFSRVVLSGGAAGRRYQLEMLLNSGALIRGPVATTVLDAAGNARADLEIDAQIHVYNEDILSLRILSPDSNATITVAGALVDGGAGGSETYQSAFCWQINQILSYPW